jgi:hypothetical protein
MEADYHHAVFRIIDIDFAGTEKPLEAERALRRPHPLAGVHA